MKIKSDHKKDEFNPINITITAESVEDLGVLWNMFNFSVNNLDRLMADSRVQTPDTFDPGPLWRMINNLIEEVK